MYLRKLQAYAIMTSRLYNLQNKYVVNAHLRHTDHCFIYLLDRNNEQITANLKTCL